MEHLHQSQDRPGSYRIDCCSLPVTAGLSQTAATASPKRQVIAWPLLQKLNVLEAGVVGSGVLRVIEQGVRLLLMEDFLKPPVKLLSFFRIELRTRLFYHGVGFAIAEAEVV